MKTELSKEEISFFKKPKSMYAIWKELFHGDAYDANNFQNWALSNNLLKWNGSTFEMTDNKKNFN